MEVDLGKDAEEDTEELAGSLRPRAASTIPSIARHAS